MGFKKNILIEEANDLSKFGKNFQIKLLSLLIKDKPFTFSILPIIKDIYFADIYLRNIFNCISEYLTEYQTTPSFDNVSILLKSKGENVDTYNNLLKTIDEIDLEDRKFVIDNTRSFCFTKHALIEQEKVVEALKKGEFENAKKISFESFKYFGDDGVKIYDLNEDYERIYEEEKMRCPVPSPLTTFNKYSKGGPGAGDIVIVVAPSNFGKSSYMVSVTRHAILNKKNVAYFSYEMTGGAIMSRYIAGLVDVKQEQLKYEREVVDRKMQEKGYGKFRIIEDKSSNATIPIIKNRVEHLKSTGFFIDLMIIDGLNQMKLTKGQWAVDTNDKYEQLTEGVKDMLKELEIPGYCTWQSNRCLGLETLVDLKDKGKIKIIELKENDEILTLEGYKKVQRIYPIEKQIVYKIKLKNGKEIICSDKHEFPLKNGELKSIETGLMSGDKLIVKKE